MPTPPISISAATDREPGQANADPQAGEDVGRTAGIMIFVKNSAD